MCLTITCVFVGLTTYRSSIAWTTLNIGWLYCRLRIALVLPDPVIPSKEKLGVLRAKSKDGETLRALKEEEKGRFTMKFPLIPSKTRFPPNDSLANTLAVLPRVA